MEESVESFLRVSIPPASQIAHTEGIIGDNDVPAWPGISSPGLLCKRLWSNPGLLVDKHANHCYHR